MDVAFNRSELAERLRRHVAALASVPRPPGSAAHQQAQDYIRDHLSRSGFAVKLDAYQAVAALPGVNVLTAPVPDQPAWPLVIVGAHYDSLPNTPGADDNASGVAALLELAALLGPRLAGPGPWSARLQLIAYDQEEFGLLGSRHHSSTVAAAAVRVMLSLEMLGYVDRRPGGRRLPPPLAGLYPDVGDFIGVVGNQATRAVAESVARSMKSIDGLPVESLLVPGDGTALPDSRRSDHASFWDRGLPALMVTDTSFFRNPHYHTATDVPDTLDYDFLARVTAGVVLAVESVLR